MRTWTLFVPVLALLGCGGEDPAESTDEPPAAVATPEVDPEPKLTGAAAAYRQHYAAFPESFMVELSVFERRDVDAEMAQVLRDHANVIDALINTTYVATCEWHTDYMKPGPSPQGKEARKLAQVLQADAYRAWNDHDARGAAERIAASIRLSRHAGQGDALLAKLVAQSIQHMALEVIDDLDEANAIVPAGRRVLLDALRMLDPDDPLDTAGVVAFERTLYPQQLEHGFWAPPLWRQAGPDRRRQALANLDRMFEDAEVAWADPNAESKLMTLEFNVQNDQLLTDIWPKLAFARGMFDEHRDRLQETVERLMP